MMPDLREEGLRHVGAQGLRGEDNEFSTGKKNLDCQLKRKNRGCIGVCQGAAKVMVSVENKNSFSS